MAVDTKVMIPAELRTRKQWVVWKQQTRPGSKKPTKVPYRPSNPKVKASSTNDTTWGTYDDARQAVKSGSADGVGFVFTDDDPYCGVDFDDVIDADGIEERVLETIKGLNTYAEVSPSGKGIHVIGRAELKSGGKKSNSAEIYDRGRFFCMTGERVAGTRAKIGAFDPDPVVKFIRNGKADNGSDKLTTQGLGPPSRHDALVSLAAQLVAAGTTRDFIEAALWAKAREIKLPKREDDEVGRIIDWALQQQGHHVRVAKRVELIKINREAEIQVQTELAANRVEFDEITGADELELPDEVVEYSVDDLFPTDSNILLMAERKTGKTALGLSLLKAFADNDPFLNYFGTSMPEGRRVCYLNYELTRGMFRRWLRRTNLSHPEKTCFLHMRGRSMPFWLPDARDELVEYCKRMEVWCMIIDPQMMACLGLVDDENNNMQLAEFHHAIDAVKELAEVPNVMVVHHIGKADKERGRGASRIEDWPDALWYLNKEDDGSRSFRAMGRDVELQPIQMSFDRDTGLYFWDGASRAESRVDLSTKELIQSLLNVFKDFQYWPNKTSALKLVTGTMQHRSKVLGSAVDRGFVRFEHATTSTKKGGKPPVRCVVTDLGKAFAGR